MLEDNKTYTTTNLISKFKNTDTRNPIKSQRSSDNLEHTINAPQKPKKKIAVYIAHGFGGSSKDLKEHFKTYIFPKNSSDYEYEFFSIPFSRKIPCTNIKIPFPHTNYSLSDKVVDFVNKNNAKERYKNEDTILFGHSRGAYAVTKAAEKFEKQREPVRAIVQNSPVYSAKKALRNKSILTKIVSPLFAGSYMKMTSINIKKTPIFMASGESDNMINKSERNNIFQKFNQKTPDRSQTLKGEYFANDDGSLWHHKRKHNNYVYDNELEKIFKDIHNVHNANQTMTTGQEKPTQPQQNVFSNMVKKARSIERHPFAK